MKDDIGFYIVRVMNVNGFIISFVELFVGNGRNFDVGIRWFWNDLRYCFIK